MGIGNRVNDDIEPKSKAVKSDKSEQTEQQPEEIFVPVEPKFSFDDMILPELRERLMTVGADLLLKTLYKLQNGGLQPIKQDDSLSTYAPLLKKDTGRIDWQKPAREVHNLIRGLYGGAFGLIDGQKFKIFRSRLVGEKISLDAGAIKIDGNRFFVGTGDSALEILEIQAPNSKKLSAADFLRRLVKPPSAS